MFLTKAGPWLQQAWHAGVACQKGLIDFEQRYTTHSPCIQMHCSISWSMAAAEAWCAGEGFSMPLMMHDAVTKPTGRTDRSAGQCCSRGVACWRGQQPHHDGGPGINSPVELQRWADFWALGSRLYHVCFFLERKSNPCCRHCA